MFGCFAMVIHYLIVILYFSILSFLSVYCLHRYQILYLYFRFKYKTGRCQPDSKKTGLPPVTIQLPIYNEKYVVKRLLTAVLEIDYPRDLLEIQVLDDSIDETSEIVRCEIDALKAKGVDIVYLHRTHRNGYKAGALQAGLDIARGDLVAVFDADFVPNPDFLKRTVPWFANERVGMVQSRWGHINRDYSLLTFLQSLFLDAHFILEHGARNRSGRFFNFNGTAGVWRKSCIVSAGGWQHETLTEDLDLSYRAQLEGWRFIFLPGVITPAEIPVDMNSFKSQQHRWAKGGIQTARKLLPVIFNSSQPVKVKLESFFHLTGNINYLLIILLAFLTYPSLLVRIEMNWQRLFWIDLFFFIGTFIPVVLFYGTALKEAGRGQVRQLLYIPLLLAFGIGLAVNNAKAVLEAFCDLRSPFVRTPKFNISTRSDRWLGKIYRVDTRTFQLVAEAFLSMYVFCALICALQFQVYAAVPFLLLFFIGFFYVFGTSVYESFNLRMQYPLEAGHDG